MSSAKKIQEASSEVITAFGDKIFDDRLNSLDRELEAVKRRSDELRDLAANNVESATDNLAFQQKKEAEIERQAEETRKAQERNKLLLAVLDAFSANIANGDNPSVAAAKALSSAEILKQGVRALPSFYEGTDLTSKGSGIDNKGGFVSILHPNEMVFSNSDRQEMGAPTTRAEVIAGYNLGKAIMHEGYNLQDRIVVQNQQDERIINRLESVERAIKSKPVYMGMDYNKLTGMVIDKIEASNKKVNNHIRLVRKH